MKRNFRISIRESTLSIVIVALAAALFLEHRQLIVERERAKTQRRRADEFELFAEQLMAKVRRRGPAPPSGKSLAIAPEPTRP